METRCGKCSKLFRVSDDKITGKGIKFTCTRCGEPVKISKEDFETYTLSQTAVSALDLFEVKPKAKSQEAAPEPDVLQVPASVEQPEIAQQSMAAASAVAEPPSDSPLTEQGISLSEDEGAVPPTDHDFLREREETPATTSDYPDAMQKTDDPFGMTEQELQPPLAAEVSEEAPSSSAGDVAVPAEHQKLPEPAVPELKQEPAVSQEAIAIPDIAPPPPASIIAAAEPAATPRPAPAPIPAPAEKPQPVVEQKPAVPTAPAVAARPAAPRSPAPAVSPPAAARPAVPAPKKDQARPSSTSAPTSVIGAATATSVPTKNLIVVAATVVVLLCCVAAYFLFRSSGPAATVNTSSSKLVAPDGLLLTNLSGAMDPAGDLVITGAVENTTDREMRTSYVAVDVLDASGKVLRTIKWLNGKQIYTRGDYDVLAKRGADVRELKQRAVQQHNAVLQARGRLTVEMRYLQPPAGIASFNAALKPADPDHLLIEIMKESK